VLGCWASERIGHSPDWRPLDAWAYLLLAAA
jgi:hypothetical protein